MQHANVEGLVKVAEAAVEEAEQFGGENHESLHAGGEHDERERDAYQGVDDGEDLAAFGEGRHVPIACGKKEYNI